MADRNPYAITPANPLQALMAGVQGFEGGSKRAKENELMAGRQEAVQALQSGGDTRGALAKLIGIGDVEGARAIAQFSEQQANRGFREQESQRAQSNADRSFGLQERQFGLEKQANERKEVPEPVRILQAAGIDPKSPEGRAALIKPKGADIGAQVEERRKAALSEGMDIKDPQVRAYILTGKLPREDQQPLTATDKKAILESDELVQANEAAIMALNQAKAVSPQAYGHPGALARGKIDALSETPEGLATVDLDNLVVGTALGQLKSIFGAAPTEGERKILLDLQGSVSLPDKARQAIFDRAITLANKRLEFNKKKADELRGQTYYKPGGKSQDQMPQGSMLPGVGQPQIIGGGSSAPTEKKRLKFNPATGEFE